MPFWFINIDTAAVTLSHKVRDVRAKNKLQSSCVIECLEDHKIRIGENWILETRILRSFIL